MPFQLVHSLFNLLWPCYGTFTVPPGDGSNFNFTSHTFHLCIPVNMQKILYSEEFLPVKYGVSIIYGIFYQRNACDTGHLKEILPQTGHHWKCIYQRNVHHRNHWKEIVHHPNTEWAPVLSDKEILPVKCRLSIAAFENTHCSSREQRCFVACEISNISYRIYNRRTSVPFDVLQTGTKSWMGMKRDIMIQSVLLPVCVWLTTCKRYRYNNHISTIKSFSTQYAVYVMYSNVESYERCFSIAIGWICVKCNFACLVWINTH